LTAQTDFTEERWVRLYRAPLVAGLGVTLADPGGPIELSKEGMAAMRSAVTPTESQGLVSDLSSGLKATLEARVNPIADLKPEAGVDPRAMILDELKEANRIVSEKATPEEVSAYRAWLMNSARNAAEAAKEGGFFGIGAVQVSEGEAALLAQLDQMLGQD
jgi:broad specificity phosphatase PhoE